MVGGMVPIHTVGDVLGRFFADVVVKSGDDVARAVYQAQDTVCRIAWNVVFDEYLHVVLRGCG
jgi:hypothetical protein